MQNNVLCCAAIEDDPQNLGRVVAPAAVEALYIALISRHHCQQLLRDGASITDFKRRIELPSTSLAAQLTLSACVMRLVDVEVEENAGLSVTPHHDVALRKGVFDVIGQSVEKAIKARFLFDGHTLCTMGTLSVCWAYSLFDGRALWLMGTCCA